MPRRGRNPPAALRPLANPPASSHPIPACVVGEFSTEGSDRETLVQKARETITDAMGTVDVHEVSGQQLVANPNGLVLFQRLDRLETQLAATQTQLADTQTQLAATQTELAATQTELAATQTELAGVKSELKPIKSLLYDAREREYVTHLRDFCDDYGVPRHSAVKKTQLQFLVSTRVNALNTGRVHAGNALADAEMFAARRPFNSDAQFRRVYGLNADQIKELGHLDYASLLQILDAVGTSRYQGRTMKEEEEGLFKEMIELIDARNFDRAEEAAKSAIEGNKFSRPLVPWPAQWDDVEEHEG